MGNNVADRELLKSVYKSKTWAKRVDRMSDNHVVAVILRLRKQGKL